MPIEETFSIIKPDATKRNLTGEINALFEKNGLEIVAQKKIKLTKAQAQEFYQEHKERSFFQSLVNYMISGAVVVQILRGENAVLKNREIMGATNPQEAANNTIREKYAESIEANSVHGSDSLESARREINFFFAQIEIIK